MKVRCAHTPSYKSRSSCQKSESAFSLIEVLVAVLILALLVAVASRGLIVSLATDTVSQQLFDGNLVMNRIEAARLRGEDFERAKALTGPRWTLSETKIDSSTTNPIAWRIVTLQSELRPSLRIQTATRAN